MTISVPQRGLWLRALSIADSTRIPRICAVIETLGITDVYIQAVVGGYAYYDSRVLPRSEVLVRTAGPDYVPFDAMYRIFKQRSIRVHAWVNALLAWSLEKRPDSSNHVLNQHPDWFMEDIFGRRMSDYEYREWRRFGTEGLFLDPGNPAVREYIADIVNDIASRYDVDGIHLDFIRYPGIWWSLESCDRSCLLQGIVSDTLQWMTLVRYCQLPFKLRWMTWNIWRLMKGREKNIDDAVSSVFSRTAVSMRSCAVTANPANARYKYGQTWWLWEDKGVFPVLMSYTQDVGLFNDMLYFASRRDADAVMGIGVIWPGMERAAAYEGRETYRSRLKGGICYFDFESLDTLADLSLLADTVNIVFDSLAFDSTRYRPVNSVFADRPMRIYERSAAIYHDQDSVLEFIRFITSLTLNRERDLKRLGLDSISVQRMIHSDVAAFEFVNDKIFPLGTMLVEPPCRYVSYDSLCWNQDDSNQIRKKALKISRLGSTRKVYPRPLDRFAKAVFSADPGVKTMIETADCVYVFKVDKIVDDSVMVPEFQVERDLKAVFSYNTAMMKLDELMR